MRALFRITAGFCKTLNLMGAFLLTTMMFLTVLDVILRYIGRPITGTFELMSFAGALVTGMALAQTSLDGAHVSLDIVMDAVSSGKKKVLTVFNRLIGLAIFGLLAWALVDKGKDLYATGEVSLTLQVPYYPVAYALAFCCLAECLVLLTELLKVFLGGEHE